MHNVFKVENYLIMIRYTLGYGFSELDRSHRSRSQEIRNKITPMWYILNNAESLGVTDIFQVNPNTN